MYSIVQRSLNDVYVLKKDLNKNVFKPVLKGSHEDDSRMDRGVL